MCVLFFFKEKKKISNKQTQLVCFHPTLRAKKNSWLLLFLLPENTVGNDHHFHLFFSVMCLKDENNFITTNVLFTSPFFTHNKSHLHRRIMCFTSKRETTMCLACKKRTLFCLCFAYTYRINVGMGHGKYKSPGLLLLCQEDEFPSCSIQCQFRFYRCIVQDAFNAPRNSKAGPICVSKKTTYVFFCITGS